MRRHDDAIVPSDAEVHAAGGVVLRRRDTTGWEVLVVHRPTYADWTLPKGKLHPGERFEAAAIREVEEETGLRCRRARELAHVAYHDARGRPKLVRYWLMEPVAGDPADRVPDAEVDEVRWTDAATVRTLLTYDDDVALVAQALEEVGRA